MDSCQSDLPQPLTERIRAAVQRGQLGQAIIFSGAGDRLAVARYAAAALQCTAAEGRPCLQCNACRKVLADIHPDVWLLRDEGHKLLPVERLRSLGADVAVLPNEGSYKIYLFPDCEQLDARGQDILLKTVEEGPVYGVFLFCAANSAALLPTLRSRCAEWKLGPKTKTVEEPSEQAKEFSLALAKKDVGVLATYLVRLEGKKMIREELSALLAEMWTLCVEAMKQQRGMPLPPLRQNCAAQLSGAWSAKELNALAQLLRQSRRACEMNISVGLVLGGLCAEWEELL